MKSVVTSSRKSRSGGSGGKGVDSLLTPILVVVIAVALLAILRPVLLRPKAAPPSSDTPAATSPQSKPTGGKRTAAPAHNGDDSADTAASTSVAKGSAKNGAKAGTTQGQPRAAASGVGSPETADDNADDSPKGDPAPVETAGIKPPQYFDNEVENKIAYVCMPASETFGPQVRTSLSDEEILAYLKRPVTILEDDDPKIVEIKERTAKLKGEALAFLEQGGTFDQFMRDLAAKGNYEAGQVEDVRVEMLKILETKGRKAAEEYLSQANPYLEEQGLPKVTISPLDLMDLEDDK